MNCPCGAPPARPLHGSAPAESARADDEGWMVCADGHSYPEVKDE